MEWIKALEGWGVPIWVLMGIVGFIVLSLLVEACTKIFGKRVPVLSIIFVKPIKYFIAKNKARKEKKEEKENLLKDMHNTLKEVKDKLPGIEGEQKHLKEFVDAIMCHCSEENINKRDKWMLSVNSDMKWAHERAKVYDESVGDLIALKDIVIQHTEQLKEQTDQIKIQSGDIKKYINELILNSEMTSQMYKDYCRNRIIDFSHGIINQSREDKEYIYTDEEFKKIHATYEDYEQFLERFGGTNGQVDTAMKVIKKAEMGEFKNIRIVDNPRV